jgi:hypothetical protein
MYIYFIVLRMPVYKLYSHIRIESDMMMIMMVFTPMNYKREVLQNLFSIRE